MTYRSKVLALSATLTALLLIYGAGLVFSPERIAARAEKAVLLKGPVSEATSISLGSLEFAKEGSAWVLLDQGLGLPVVASRVDSLLSSLAAVTRLSPRSDSGQALDGLGLGQGQGRRVFIKSAAGKVLADFELGGYSPTGDEVYVSLGGTGKAYAAGAAFASALGQERAAWLDLRVVQPGYKPEEITSIAVKASVKLDAKVLTTADWSGKRKDGGWASSGAKLDPVAVESVLRSILTLEGQDILAQVPASAFAKVQARIDLGTDKGGQIGLELGAAADADRFYLRSSAGGQVYLVSAWSLKNLLRPTKAL